MKKTFQGHYIKWRSKRIAAIANFYGKSYFKNKTILELGAGECDIGAYFSKLGADVTCWEARPQNVATAKEKYPHLKIEVVDCENLPEIEKKFDLIIHMGLLYHLSDCETSLKWTIANCHSFVLETEVCDSDDPNVTIEINEDSSLDDQSFSGKGVRPSGARLEQILREFGCEFQRVNDSRCNADIHVYDWKVKETKEWTHGLRRFWFVGAPKLPKDASLGRYTDFSIAGIISKFRRV